MDKIKITEKEFNSLIQYPFIIMAITENKNCYIEGAEYNNIEDYIHMEGRTSILSSYTLARIDALNGG